MGGLIDFRFILNVLSRILFILTGAMIMSAGVAIIYSESLMPFTVSVAILLLLSIPLFYGTRQSINHEDLHQREAYLTVTLSWLVIGLAGALPFILSGAIPSFTDALFESVSGFTTTGSSILTDIEALPKSILFWRSTTHWIGGIGIIVLVIIIMPSLKISGYHLFTMESSLQEKMRARIKSVGRRLFIVYISLTVAEIIFLRLGRMNLFESVCHAFGTVATGGFSPKNTSIADYSPYIQYVIMVFMVLAGTNFAVLYYLFVGNFRKIKENEEIVFYLLVIVAIGTIVSSILLFSMHLPIEKAFRDGFFQVISIITCTGFSSADYMQWPQYAWFIIFIAMFIGGSTGSTAGGIKIVRHLVLFRNVSRTFHQMIWPNAIIPVKLNKSTINNATNNTIMSYIIAYLMVFGAGSLLLLLLGVRPEEAVSSVATCMAGIGPGLGRVGPVGNFAHLSDIVKIILAFLMIVGRLEIFTVLVIFTRNFWRN